MANLIFGKIFSSMFTGSMMGAGSHVFALMSYVICHMQPGEDREEYVRLNPKLLAMLIGDTEVRIQAAIEVLCGQDDLTTTPGEEGKRLVLHSPFLYRVVNGRHYRELRDEDDRRNKAAARQSAYRAKHPEKANQYRKPKSVPLPGEIAAVKGQENGTHDENFEPVKPDPGVKTVKAFE